MGREQVPLQELKRRLSYYVRRAAEGERIVITRHNRPIAQLGAPERDPVRTGARHGEGLPGPLLRGAAGGRALELLREDRQGGEPWP